MNGDDSMLARLAPLTLVVGKGGVGKTTIAAALAMRFARESIRTLVVTTDPAASLFPALGRPIEKTPRPVSLSANLDGWTFDPDSIRAGFLARWREPIARIMDRGTYLDADDIAGLVDAALPGADEIFAILALGDVLSRPDADRYDRIVVDTAPTGHTLRLLGLPGSFDALVRLLDAMQEKHRFMVRALTHRYRADSADALIDELRGRVAVLQKTFSDRTRASALLVTRPEPVVVAESERYVAALQLSGVEIAAIVINTWTGSADERSTVAPLLGGSPVFTVAHVADPSQVLDSLHVLDNSPMMAPPVTPSTRVPLQARASVAVEPLTRPLTIVGGKGGVGKTTVACAIAIAISSDTHPTLLVSTDPAPSIGDALALDVGDSETPVPDVRGLVARQMDASRAFATFREQYQERIDSVFASLAGRGLDMAHDRGIVRDLLSLAPPGIDELYALTVLGETLAEGRFATIIIDPAPTGHLLRLLDMPALAVSWSHQLMRMMLKYKEVVGLGETAEELLAFARRTRVLDQRLKNPDASSAVLVALDEPLVRNETDRLVGALGDRSLPPRAIIWNRATDVTPPLPTALAIPQYFAPAAERGPVGVRAIRDWTKSWGTLSR